MLYLKSGGRQTTDSQTTTPLPPRLHPYGEKTIRGSVARPTLHRPHERALAAESRGRLVGRIAGTYLYDITRVSQVDGGARGAECGDHRVP